MGEGSRLFGLYLNSFCSGCVYSFLLDEFAYTLDLWIMAYRRGSGFGAHPLIPIQCIRKRIIVDGCSYIQKPILQVIDNHLDLFFLRP